MRSSFRNGRWEAGGGGWGGGGVGGWVNELPRGSAGKYSREDFLIFFLFIELPLYKKQCI